MRTFTICMIFGLVAALAATAQTENTQGTQLVSDHPAVKAAVEKFIAESSPTGSTGLAKSGGPRFASAGPVFGFGYQLQTPPVVLRLNRSQFDDKEVLQSSLVVLPETNKGGNPGPVNVSHIMVNTDTNQTRGGFVGTISLLAGQIVPLQTYIFDGSEPSGLYAYVATIFDAATGQLLAMPVTWFSFRCFFRSDARGYLRVDSAENHGRYVLLRGNFRVEASPSQFVFIRKQTFPIVRSSPTEALVDLGDQWALPAGMHDITLVVHHPGNTSYDSTTAPGALKVFLPVPPAPTAPMPPLPGPPSGKG